MPSIPDKWGKGFISKSSRFLLYPVPLLKGKWWNVPKQVHNVPYLDFENMGAMESKKQTFQSGYIPEARADECRANLIMKDVADCAIDFSLPENHQKILDGIFGNTAWE